MNSRSGIGRLVRYLPTEIWWAIIALAFTQVLLLLLVPVLRQPSRVRLLLFGPYIFLALFASLLLAPALDVIGFEYAIPDYRPWHFSEVAFVAVVNLSLITLAALIIHASYFRSRLPRDRAIRASVIWSFVLVHIVGGLLMAGVAAIVGNLGY